MPEEGGAILFVIVVILIPAVIVRAVQKWREASAWIRATQLDYMPSPHSDRLWSDFEAAERGDHRV